MQEIGNTFTLLILFFGIILIAYRGHCVCPVCAEKIKKAALVCPRCNRDVKPKRKRGWFAIVVIVVSSIVALSSGVKLFALVKDEINKQEQIAASPIPKPSQGKAK